VLERSAFTTLVGHRKRPTEALSALAKRLRHRSPRASSDRSPVGTTQPGPSAG
jgi:hypothetical protein